MWISTPDKEHMWHKAQKLWVYSNIFQSAKAVGNTGSLCSGIINSLVGIQKTCVNVAARFTSIQLVQSNYVIDSDEKCSEELIMNLFNIHHAGQLKPVSTNKSHNQQQSSV